jgi:sugar O-acyltransferase (sialic acid O-acetyltransferase NeuD family)
METILVSKPCLIIGCGSHSYSVISIIESSDEFVISGLIDTGLDYDISETKSSYSVVGNLELIDKHVDTYKGYFFAIAVGDNSERARIYQKINELGLSTPNFISKHAFVDRNVNMGDGNIIAHNVVLNSMVELGSNNLINTAAIVEHNAIVGDHNHLGPMSIMCGNSRIKSHCFLGVSSKILPNKRLSSNCTLGAGAVLIKSIETVGKVLIGAPAKEK